MNRLLAFESISTYGLKPWFQNLLRPLVRILARSGVSANQITVFTCVLSGAFSALLINHLQSRMLLLLMPLFLFVRLALNAIDGILARDFDQKSKLGVYLNELGDVVSDAFCYLPFAYLSEFDPLWIGAVIALCFISEFAGMIGPSIGATRRYDGPMGKSDRAFAFGMMAMWLGAGLPLGHTSALLFSRVMVVLVALTIINRVRAGLAEAEDQAPTISDSQSRQPQECFFESHDGIRLFYRYWPALEGSEKQAIVLLHRGHEHSGRVRHIVDELDFPGFAMFAWDARGHGRSALLDGQSPGLGTFVKDLDSFIRHISITYGIPTQNIALVSQSVGSVFAATWIHDYAPQIRCMVLAAPAFKVKLYLPFARTVLKLLHTLLGDFHVNSYVKPWALTHDPERIASYKADRLITRPISVRLLLGLYSASRRIVADAEAIQVPTQLLTSNSDWVVSTRPQFEFFERLGAGAKEKHVFDGFYHDLLGERDRYLVIEKVRAFILKMFASTYQKPLLLEADKEGYTKAEFDGLTEPLAPLSPQWLGFALLKLGIKTGGRLSDGIRLGLKTGFDSGSTLDYVYRNHASGMTPIGKLLDWFFLHAIGWRGVRQRKRNIVQALLRSMEQLRAAGRPVRILDIAAGQGRYIFEALRQHPFKADSVLLRDFSEINVRLGSALVRANGLEDIFRFEQGDAFDRNALAEIRPRPTLAVVSGLYELFPDNSPVRESLAGLRRAIDPGGFLIYTGQPYHPQLQMIARTLSSHRSGPWIMRRRTQAELDQLVQAAGFEKVHQWIDDWGMFSVSIARRIGRHA